MRILFFRFVFLFQSSSNRSLLLHHLVAFLLVHKCVNCHNNYFSLLVAARVSVDRQEY